MAHAIVAVEMLSLTYNGIMEFKEAPTLNNVSFLVSDPGTVTFSRTEQLS